MKKSEGSTRVMPITFEGKPERPIALRAYLFNREGKLLQTADVQNDEVRFSSSFKSIGDVRIMIAPADEGNKSIEIRAGLQHRR